MVEIIKPFLEYGIFSDWLVEIFKKDMDGWTGLKSFLEAM